MEELGIYHFLNRAASLWPDFRAPSYIDNPAQFVAFGLGIHHRWALDRCLYGSPSLSEAEVIQRFQLLNMSPYAIRLLKDHPKCLELVQKNIPNFLGLIEFFLAPQGGVPVPIYFSEATDAFELLGKAIQKGNLFDDDFIKRFRRIVVNWIKCFGGVNPTHQRPLTFAFNVAPFILSLASIAEKAPQLMGSFDLTYLHYHLGYRENLFESCFPENLKADERNFLREFLALNKIPAHQEAAVDNALQILRRHIPRDPSNKLP